MFKNIKHSLFGLMLLSGIASADLGEFHWDWSKIDTDSVSFDKDFMFGTAVSMYQVAGGDSSNWATCNVAKDEKGKPRISHGQMTGIACDFWNHLDEDIKKLVDMKVKAFRFSIEWADIEPQEGHYDTAALARYHDLCDRLANVGIKSVVTLHHFVHPTWFEDKGAFEKEENITCFVTYARTIVKEFGDKVAMWATFNEP
ncbi:MAG: family 1 glycosylhydrolase, partial [Candidatus Babeliales bacterium]|nr:family 1 glycosylhydrolase [Candidatus Babeliales bacterium]